MLVEKRKHLDRHKGERRMRTRNKRAASKGTLLSDLKKRMEAGNRI